MLPRARLLEKAVVDSYSSFPAHSIGLPKHSATGRLLLMNRTDTFKIENFSSEQILSLSLCVWYKYLIHTRTQLIPRSEFASLANMNVQFQLRETCFDDQGNMVHSRWCPSCLLWHQRPLIQVHMTGIADLVSATSPTLHRSLLTPI